MRKVSFAAFISASACLTVLNGCALFPKTPGREDLGIHTNVFNEKFGAFDKYIDAGDYAYGLAKEKLCTFKGGSLISVNDLHPTDANFLVNYDGYFDSNIGTKAAIIHIGDGATDSDMLARESRNYLKNLLNLKGIKPVDDIKDSDITVLVSIGISDPDVQTETIQVPVYNYDGPTTSNTTITGDVNASATTTTQGQGLYVSGYRNQTVTNIYYTRYVLLKAVDTKKFIQDKTQEAVWQIRTFSTGSMGDIRRALPVHYGVMLEYFGENTGGIIDRRIAERSFFPTLISARRSLSGK